MLIKRLNEIKNLCPENVTLVAVSKTKPKELIVELFNNGQFHFGENKVQELVGKYEALSKDIKWHMIGHLQSNKVKYIAPFVYLIHGVDSIKLLKEINRQALKNGRIINVLLQFHIASEQTKFGFSLVEITDLLTTDLLLELRNVSIVGVMGMATFTEDNSQIRREFSSLRAIFEELKISDITSSTFKEISMGMSGDFEIAIEEGSTMIRVGSRIFGSR